MGTYINIGNEGFRSARQDEYVDKSGLISVVNSTIGTRKRFTCVTRSRRFGKSLAAEMLCAYYDKSCDSRSLFEDLEIGKAAGFEEHLNKYPVIYIDMTAFITRYRDASIVRHIQKEVSADISECYADIVADEKDDLMAYLIKVATRRKEKFILIIDEWDAICRECPAAVVDEYVDLLRRMFKEMNAVNVFAAVYMTGILPIKKYNTQSALNNFEEYSMTDPGNMATFFGFTKDEVRLLAGKYQMDFGDLEKWYDGYTIGSEHSIFNPNSVMKALSRQWCQSYWASTGAYDAIVNYIKMNFDGLKDNIISLLAGGRVKVNTTKFENDLSIINNRDDVLTVLIHLGYLSYDRVTQQCYVPNKEVAIELANAVESADWAGVTRALEASEKLLNDTLEGDAEAVARGVDATHDENTSILSYNDENSLACVLSIAYYYAKNDYVVHRELASGKGFADLVLIPRKNVSKPALLLELKYNQDADTAIQQIHRKQYPQKVAEYTGEMLLVGINYDKVSKMHTCQIERCLV